MSNFDDFFTASPEISKSANNVVTEFRPSPRKGQGGVFKAIVRFVPNPSDPVNKSLISKRTVMLTDPANTSVRKMIDCPSTGNDPITSTYFALRNSNNDVLKANAQMFSRKLKFASYVQVLSCDCDPSIVNRILVWSFGQKVFEKLEAEKKPAMGTGHNPWDLINGRPFGVIVKEVSGYPNYDSCSFYDAPIEQGGFHIVNTDAMGQQTITVVTPQTISTAEGRQMVFEYIKNNAPDISKHEEHAWTPEEADLVNRCITTYSNPQASMALQRAVANPGMTMPSTPMGAQTASSPMFQTAPTPTMGLDAQNVAQTDTRGYSAPQVPSDVNALISGGLGGQTATPSAGPSIGLGLEDVLNGQMY